MRQNFDFLQSLVLTALDVIVFMLCVDQGIKPVTIVGACYVALRLFNQDSTRAVNLLGPVMDNVVEAIKRLTEKTRSRKETSENEAQ